ncbi:MAG: exosortase-associated EpsI family protein [Planctomycetes bacterium]|nr:exosortase-associated EpsI family protein [Planctomycetota bacterium]NOG53527.1 exosortase-associated EpsI family protein [Planctomycetota bacterium]
MRTACRYILDTLAVLLVVAILGAGTYGFRVAQKEMRAVLIKKPVPLRHSFSELPRHVGDWQRIGSDAELTAEVEESLGTDLYLSRDYALQGDPDKGILRFHIAYYTGMIDAVPHVPERCYVGSGYAKSARFEALPVTLDQSGWWQDREGGDAGTSAGGDAGDAENGTAASGADAPASSYWMTRSASSSFVRLPLVDGDSIRMNIRQYWSPSRPEVRFSAGYFFVANGWATPYAERVRLLAFDLTDVHAYYCKVQLTYEFPDASVEPSELAEVAGEFLNTMLPEIMYCLPDWSEVEQSAASEGSGGASDEGMNDGRPASGG